MSTISTIEDTIISTITNLNIFKYVSSLGRKKQPESLSYPAAFVYFIADRDTGTKPRPVMELNYVVRIMNKNLQLESKAAKDIYDLLDDVRDALNFKALGLTDIEPLTCISREFVDYQDGVISYILKFKTRHYLAVPA